MPVAQVNGQQINYSDSGGDGPVIIWSHGYLMDHTMFAPQIEALSDNYRCVAWDERGFGATPANGPFSYWDSADDAVALLEHLGIGQAVFAGMSQGGFLSMRAALAHPERIRGLILIDTQAGQENPEVVESYRGMIEHWMGPEPLGDVGLFVGSLILGAEDLMAKWIPVWEGQRAAFSEHAANCLLERDDITERVAEISSPALVIHGDADAAIALELGQYLADTIPNASMSVMSGGTHAANLTNPDECNAVIREFLAGLPGY